MKLADGPADVKADRVMTSGCETNWSGNVTMQLGKRSLKADLLRIRRRRAHGVWAVDGRRSLWKRY
jgi:lipopolysaccharide export system protein LptA